ncbi:MAG: translation initiation factor [Deltaproteobacteria bacterium]|nr:translation initiation factor [Deltaproteobacteria bacterium]
MARDSGSLVFSTDGSHLRACTQCGRQPCVCPGDVAVLPAQTLLRLRLDKKGRGGKAVTVVYDLPRNPEYFADLLKKLKTHCGAGGTLKEDALELQGDHRDTVHAYLERLGFQVRRSGG